MKKHEEILNYLNFLMVQKLNHEGMKKTEEILNNLNFLMVQNKCYKKNNDYAYKKICNSS